METFTVTIGVCDITGINLDTTLAGTTKTYNVAQGQANYAYTPFTFNPAVCTNYGITYTAQWNDATVLKTLPAFIVYNQASSRFEVNTSTETDDGTYVIRLTGDMDDPQTETAFIEFTIVVVGCPSTVVSAGSGVTDPSTYTIGSGAQTYSDAFSQTISRCTLTYALTGDLGDAAFSFSTTTGVITFDASDASVYNGKSFTLTVTATEAFSTSTDNYSFTLNMNDPCESATITDDITWQNMVTTVGFEGTLVSPTQTQTFAEYKDSVSTVNGDNSGTTFCGNRKYTFAISPTPNPVTPSPIALNTGTRTFTLDTDEATHATVVYTITLTITLADYEASITALTKTFTATVNPCVITGQASGNELEGTT